MEPRHPEECDIFGKLCITGHYYYRDRCQHPDFDILVDTTYKSRGRDVGYFRSEDELIKHFTDRIIDKSKGFSIEVSSCTKSKPYGKRKKPYPPGYIDMLRVSLVLDQNEVTYVILRRA